MPEARLYTAAAKQKGSYALPEEFDGTVNHAALYHAVRAYRNNRRQGTHATKTRSEVSGGTRKPWRQKGTGRARQGTTRAAHWRGGGVVFGPRPRDYRTELPRKVRRLARQSALNERAKHGQLLVIEGLEFDRPRTRTMVDLLSGLGLADQKVLLLTAEARPSVYLSGRNLPGVHVMRYAEASAYEVLWSDAVVVEESAIGGHAIAKRTTTGRATRAKKAQTGTAKKKATGRAMTKKGGSATRAAGKTKMAKGTKRKGGGNA